MQLMLRRLLLERFKLNVRSVSEDFPIFALTVKRSDRITSPALRSVGPCQGARPQQAGQSECGEIMLANNAFIAKGISMKRFAEVLSRSPTLTGADRLVVDHTGLTGLYWFEIKFARTPTPGLRLPDSSGLPEFATALDEQLGLRLEPTRAPTNILIVQHATLPVPD